MVLSRRSIRYAALLLAWNLFCWSGLDSTHALDIHWNGSGGPFGDPESWHNVDNWDPAGSPFQVHRVPGDGDTAMLSTPTNDVVRLQSNTAPINGLIVSNGVTLFTNGSLLSVDTGGFAGTATTAIGGPGSSITVDHRTAGAAFVTDNLLVTGGGALLMGLGDATVEGNTTLLNQGRIDNTSSVGHRELTFGGDLTMVNGALLLNTGGVANFVGGGTVSLSQGAIMNLTQQLNIHGGMTFNLQTGAEVQIAESISIDSTSTLEIVSAIMETDQDIHLDGGTLRLGNTGEIRWGENSFFRAENNAQLFIDGVLHVGKNSQFVINSGTDIVAPTGRLTVEGSDSGRHAIVSDVGTTFDLLSVSVGNNGINQSSFKVEGGASGTIGSISVGGFSVSPGELGYRGIVYVETGAHVEVTGDIEVGTEGDGPGREGQLFVVSEATLTQTSGGATLVGQASGMEGVVFVNDGASYSSNTQPFLVENTGRLLVRGSSQPGVMRINGPLTVNGIVTVGNSSSCSSCVGGVLRVNAPMSIDGGTMNLHKGMLAADSISFANPGAFDFTSGRLTVGVFNGDLAMPIDGVLAPGPTDSDSGAGETAIVGDLSFLTGTTLEIEIGGKTMGSQFDFVDVANNAALGGDLALSLINSFLPDPTDTFLIFNAGNLLSSFNNIGNGGRLSTTDGGGSFQVNYGVASQFISDQIVLSDFLPSLGADLDNDGDVDGADFLAIQRTNPALIPLWESQYGNGSPLASSQSVPEPSTLLLVIFAFTAKFTRSSHRATL